jgi:hypothetical protein
VVSGLFFAAHCNKKFAEQLIRHKPLHAMKIMSEAQPLDDIVAVFETGLFSKGWTKGYRILVTNTKLFGQKAYEGDYTWWANYPGKNQDEKVRKKAAKLYEEIQKKKEFETTKENITKIELMLSPSVWKTGYLKFQFGGNEISLKLAATGDKGFAESLTNSLRNFAGDKFELKTKQ